MQPDILKETFFQQVEEHTHLHFPHYRFANAIFRVTQENRAYLMQWLPWVEHTNEVQDTMNFIGESLKFNEGGQRLVTIIMHQQKVAGSISFVKIHKTHRRGEIGYWLRENLQGKGIITKACNTLIQYGFQTLNLNRIEIRADANNLPSRAVPKRLGFQLEATLREDEIRFGEFRDTVIYGMLKKEYENGKMS